MPWEYHVEQLHIRKVMNYSGEGIDTDEIDKRLNSLGDHGWEAVTVWTQGIFSWSKTYILLKRPK
jgi:hypothetical protein